MLYKFDKQGNLENDLVLTINEFQEAFGYNEARKKKIQSLIKIASIISAFNCDTMYVGGSFVTTKGYPNDLDVCFDITYSDFKNFVQQHYELVSDKSLRKIHQSLDLHIFYFKSADTRILDWLKSDRQHNKCGIVKISLKDLQGYDKE